MCGTKMRLGNYGKIRMTNAHFWRDRRVLITGCTGMLGSWMSLRLLQLGADVVGIVRDNVPHSELVRAGTIKENEAVLMPITGFGLKDTAL